MIILNFFKSRFRKWLNEEIWLKDYIKAGLKIGNNCDIQPRVNFDISHCWLIEIGNNVTIAPEAYFLAHDASTQRHLNLTKIGKIVVGNNCFIGARALIMPNVNIGNNVVVAAGSVVTKSVNDNEVVGGNPAKFIMHTDELWEKHKKQIENVVVYDTGYLSQNGVTKKMKDQMSADLENQIGYIV